MDLEIRRFDSVELSKSFPRSANPTFSVEETPDKYGHLQITESSKEPVVTKKKPGLVELVLRDDKQQLVAESKLIDLTIDQSIVPKLLVLSCAFDSVQCAASILHGDLGEVPLPNSTDEQGKSPLHAAAEQHSARCVELLLRKRARTDIRTKDGRAQLPLELSLSSWRMEVIWNPNEHSIEDLIAVLGQKDLTAIKLLSAKTKAIDDVAYACAMGGRIVALAALLMVAAKEVNESILVLHDAQSGSKEETTVYECVIREALALGCTMTSSSVSSLKRNCSRTAGTMSETAEKRKILLCEIELLQLFGAVAHRRLTDKRVASPLILAVQAGDGDIVELLLKTSIDVNDADDDAEGNSALHWCLKSSKASCLPQKKILWLLLKHGARVSQKNKLGLTALHVAAEKGNTESLQILLLEEPDCINYKSEMKETPLFYAVKNDHLVCTEILLLWGAEREVFNLRQRPIDLAVSQDMRFILSPANIRHMNRVVPVQKKCNGLLASDEVASDGCEKLKATVVKGTNVDRGDKCVFSHGEEKLQQTMQGGHVLHASSAMRQERNFFVGGLPPSLDSDSLAKLLAENFGSVEDASVMEDETGKRSQGFGFITFKHEKSVSAAVDSHYVTIGGKQVEIKSAIPKCLLCPELQKGSPGRSPRQLEQEQTEQYEPHVQTTTEKTANDMPKKTTNEGAPKRLSWVDTLLNSDPKTCSNEFQTNFSHSLVDKSMPIWFISFKKWFRLFLEKVSKREGDYALSSLKADFKVECGLELDHASLGYSKLSDFMRSLSDLCHMKYVATGARGHSNHMILEPKHPTPYRQPLANCSPPSCTMLIDGNEDCKSSNSKSPQDHVLISDENVDFIGSCIKENLLREAFKEKSVQKDASPSVPFRFLQFLKPDHVFPAKKWLHNKEANLDHHHSHVILEALARRRNKSSFFTREFDFYKNYKESIGQGKCFGCNQLKIMWANFPCQHLLWCGDCKIQVTNLACLYKHKCVICDKKVEKIDIVPLYAYHQPICHVSSDEFPPLDPDDLQRK